MHSDRQIQQVSSTVSLCPVCLRRIPAVREQQGDSVYLVKHCPEHGNFRTVIRRGPVEFSPWLRPKEPSIPQQSFTAVDQGCPFDCGLCPEHGQHTCTALIEITSRCNLHCPVCFADAGGTENKKDEPSLTRIGFLYDRIMAASGPCNIQLSGGEPTMWADLPAIIALGRSKGFSFLQLNTNGLCLAANPNYAGILKKAGLSSVFLQFDGLCSATHTTLRGRDLTAVKEQALLHCQAAGLAVVLVPTLIPGVNTHEVGAIIDYAIRFAPTVRGVHFQPVSCFGRMHKDPADEDRPTLPEVISRSSSPLSPLSRSEIEGYQAERLRSLVDFCRERSSFYRRTFTEAGVTTIKGLENLTELPLTCEDDLRSHGSQMVCVSLDAVARIITLQSSGTTGHPGKRILEIKREEIRP